MPTKSLHFPHLLSALMLLLVGFPGFFFQEPHGLPLERQALTPNKLVLGEEASPTAAGGNLGILSIAAADFRPSVASHSYENHARFLIHSDGTGTYGYYFAPLLLPQGATITRFTLLFRDNSTSNLTAKLFRDDYMGMNTEMAALDSSGTYPVPSYGSKIATSILQPTIDNSQYAYFVSLEMPESTADPGPLVWFSGVSIEFQYPSTPTTTGYFSMPVAGFTPYQDGYTYLNTGRYLYHNKGPGGDTTNNGWYFARVHLPDGATVNSLTLYYDINSSYPGYVRLQRTRLGYGDFSNLATLTIPSGGPGHDDQTTTAISNAVVDNAQYAYWVSLDIPPLDRPNSSIIPFYTVINFSKPATASSSVPVSIPAAAFNPYEDGYDYLNDARYLHYFQDPLGGNDRGWFLAPVQIPHGSRVTRVAFYWNDQATTDTGTARLQRTDMVGNFEELATLASDGELVSGTFGKTITTSISNPIIDNRYHAYWVIWDLPVTVIGGVGGCGMIVNYSFLLYLPAVRK